MKLLSVLSLVLLIGCVHHKQPVFNVPTATCLKQIKITDFTKTCHHLKADTFTCDGVIVHVLCGQYEVRK